MLNMKVPGTTPVMRSYFVIQKKNNLLICSLILIPQVSDVKLRNWERPPLLGDEIWKKKKSSQKTIDQISYRNMMGWLSCNDCFSRCLWNKSQVDVKRKIKITSYEGTDVRWYSYFSLGIQRGLTTSTNKIKVKLFCCRILSSF